MGNSSYPRGPRLLLEPTITHKSDWTDQVYGMTHTKRFQLLGGGVSNPDFLNSQPHRVRLEDFPIIFLIFMLSAMSIRTDTMHNELCYYEPHHF